MANLPVTSVPVDSGNSNNNNLPQQPAFGSFGYSWALHVAAEIAVIGGITFVFNSKVKALEREIVKLKQQLELKQPVDGNGLQIKQIMANQMQMKEFLELHFGQLYNDVNALKQVNQVNVINQGKNRTSEINSTSQVSPKETKSSTSSSYTPKSNSNSNSKSVTFATVLTHPIKPIQKQNSNETNSQKKTNITVINEDDEEEDEIDMDAIDKELQQEYNAVAEQSPPNSTMLLQPDQGINDYDQNTILSSSISSGKLETIPESSDEMLSSPLVESKSSAQEYDSFVSLDESHENETTIESDVQPEPESPQYKSIETHTNIELLEPDNAEDEVKAVETVETVEVIKEVKEVKKPRARKLTKNKNAVQT